MGRQELGTAASNLTTGQLESHGNRYPMLAITVQEQMVHDATVQDSYWGQQGYVPWTARSPQLQRAVHKLLDGHEGAWAYAPITCSPQQPCQQPGCGFCSPSSRGESRPAATASPRSRHHLTICPPSPSAEAALAHSADSLPSPLIRTCDTPPTSRGSLHGQAYLTSGAAHLLPPRERVRSPMARAHTCVSLAPGTAPAASMQPLPSPPGSPNSAYSSQVSAAGSPRAGARSRGAGSAGAEPPASSPKLGLLKRGASPGTVPALFFTSSGTVQEAGTARAATASPQLGEGRMGTAGRPQSDQGRPPGSSPGSPGGSSGYGSSRLMATVDRLARAAQAPRAAVKQRTRAGAQLRAAQAAKSTAGASGQGTAEEGLELGTKAGDWDLLLEPNRQRFMQHLDRVTHLLRLPSPPTALPAMPRTAPNGMSRSAGHPTVYHGSFGPHAPSSAWAPPSRQELQPIEFESDVLPAVRQALSQVAAPGGSSDGPAATGSTAEAVQGGSDGSAALTHASSGPLPRSKSVVLADGGSEGRGDKHLRKAATVGPAGHLPHGPGVHTLRPLSSGAQPAQPLHGPGMHPGSASPDMLAPWDVASPTAAAAASGSHVAGAHAAVEDSRSSVGDAARSQSMLRRAGSQQRQGSMRALEEQLSSSTGRHVAGPQGSSSMQRQGSADMGADAAAARPPLSSSSRHGSLAHSSSAALRPSSRLGQPDADAGSSSALRRTTVDVNEGAAATSSGRAESGVRRVPPSRSHSQAAGSALAAAGQGPDSAHMLDAGATHGAAGHAATAGAADDSGQVVAYGGAAAVAAAADQRASLPVEHSLSHLMLNGQGAAAAAAAAAAGVSDHVEAEHSGASRSASVAEEASFQAGAVDASHGDGVPAGRHFNALGSTGSTSQASLHSGSGCSAHASPAHTQPAGALTQPSLQDSSQQGAGQEGRAQAAEANGMQHAAPVMLHASSMASAESQGQHASPHLRARSAGQGRDDDGHTSADQPHTAGSAPARTAWADSEVAAAQGAWPTQPGAEGDIHGLAGSPSTSHQSSVQHAQRDVQGAEEGQRPWGQQEAAEDRSSSSSSVLPQNPVQTSGIRYTVVRSVAAPLPRKEEVEAEQRARELQQLEEGLDTERTSRATQDASRAAKALRKMAGNSAAVVGGVATQPAPPTDEGLTMLRTSHAPGRAVRTSRAGGTPAAPVPQPHKKAPPTPEKQPQPALPVIKPMPADYKHKKGVTDIGAVQMQDIWA